MLLLSAGVCGSTLRRILRLAGVGFCALPTATFW